MDIPDEVRKFRNVSKLARQDLKYRKMVEEYRALERQFENLTLELSNEEQDIAWGFVCLSDDMNWRMIEILCDRFGIDLLGIDLGQ